MRVIVFTSNQPRHIACLEALQAAGHDVTAIIEPKTWRPGQGSEVLTRYWQRVQAAEAKVFGLPRAWSGKVIVAPMGEVSALPWLPLSADRLIVFGSSFITGALAELLIERGALNLHIGIAPEYRGSACTFWASFDGHPEYVGAQVQRLGKGVDTGEILTQANPLPSGEPFLDGMRAVADGIHDLVRLVGGPGFYYHSLRANDTSKTIRYSRGKDFTEQVAAAYLKRLG